MLVGGHHSHTVTHTRMPFLISFETREICEVTKCPRGRWMNISIPCKRLENWHHELEWSYVPAYGIRNLDTGDIIVQTRDMAYDIEYYYRGSDEISHAPGTPMSVEFS
jgi:hypothetical protein